MSYLEELNEPQREAVTNTEGPMMIIAGAGSGKTRVLTYRIAHLIEKGVEPFNILSLTFTNKAAKEMRERIEKMVGSEARNLWMGTFHSVFAKILRIEADRLGYQSNFTIYDSDDSKSLIKNIVKDLALDDKRYKPNQVLSRISNAKNNLISWRKYQNSPQFRMEDETNGREKFGEIYKEYATRCFLANAMDFDDLLYNTNILFQNPQNLDILNKYQQRFKYVLVDEFQDTNHSQYAITKKLSAVNENICVVGDDAQSIYAFRGANIQNILNFEKEYPELKTVKLEQNYRSTQNIVKAANSLIAKNTAQLKKDTWTSNETGNQIQLIKASSDNEEGRLIADAIFQDKSQLGLKNDDFAILYRTNAQSRALEEALRKLNITYKIIGGLSFYHRKEVKDLVAYLRLVSNASDVEAFKRIVNYPKRGIGKTTVEKLLVKANELGVSVWEIVLNIKQHFGSGRTATLLDDFATMIKSFQINLEKLDAFQVATQIAKSSGILKDLYDDKSVEGKVRYDNLQELLNAVKAFVDDPENEDKTLGTFLQQVSLVSSADKDTQEDAVTLMTIHMSKGLEFKNVYIAGLEENLFPSQMMLEKRSDLEEERRLFYVAITRAETKLTISYALQRYRFGKLLFCEPSRFIDEIDPKFLEDSLPSFGGSSKTKSFGFKEEETPPRSNFAQTLKVIPRKKVIKGKDAHIASSSYKPSNPDDLQEGMKVEHLKFGFGKIQDLEVFGNDKRAKVNFDKHGVKTLLLSFAKLMIH